MESYDQMNIIKEACGDKTFRFQDGTVLPRLGMGTWRMGESSLKAENEVKAIRTGISLGLKLIDTAEMYGDGGAEKLIGEAITGIARESIFLVSKVYPHNAGRREIYKSCEASLTRMKTEYLDLYLLHWRGSVPLAETLECIEKLVIQKKILRWGVSNFDVSDMKELWNTSGGKSCAANQVLYHLGSRGIEYKLLPWLEQKGIPAIAYSPLAQDGKLHLGIMQNNALLRIAEKHRASPEQILIAFALQNKNMAVIPKSSDPVHVKNNAASVLIEMDDEDNQILSAAFPAPIRKIPLDIS